MKKNYFLKLMTVLLMLLSATRASAYDFKVDGLEYKITSSNTVEVTGGWFINLTIPNSVTYNNVTYSVTSIGNSAFRSNYSLKSVTIGNNVTSIGNSAFEDCYFLSNVTIPNSVTTIGPKAFYYCQYLPSIELPNSIVSIGYSAFYNCFSLVSANIPNEITTIESSLFCGCSSLASIYIPNSVTCIERRAFCGCSSITNITIPVSVREISENPFENCSSLKQITVANDNNYYDSRNNCNAIIETSTNKLITGCQNTNILNSVTAIGDYAFKGCIGLTSEIIPNSVTAIGIGAFEGCTNLTNISIPNSVSEIAPWVFDSCISLISISIPNSIKSIGNYAFGECSSLTSIQIPYSVIDIYRPFPGCDNLSSVKVDSNNPQYDSRDDCNAIIEKSTNKLIAGCKSTIIPNSVNEIGEDAFYACYTLNSINIPNSVTAIGDYAFYSCHDLCEISIGDHISSIGEEAFSWCTSLTNMYCYATEVPSTSGGWYEAPLENATLYIPIGCKDVYSASAPWSGFGQIVEIDVDSSLFPDCPPGELRDAAIYLYRLGIVEGENGKLLPNREAKRAEVAKISLYGAYNGRSNVPAVLPSDNYPSVYYDLQDHSTYYYRSAKALLYLEYGDGVSPFDRDRLAFEPEATISRVNVLKVLLEAFNFKPDLSSNSNPFPNDADVAALASKNPVKMGYIRRAVELGIITTANTTFRPHDNITRGEAILMLARLMQKTSWQKPQDGDYFEPLNLTLKTIALGLGLPMGNFSHYTKTSFALNGVMPLIFDHTYNSYNTTLPEVFYGALTINDAEVTYQPMGEGWSHSYHSFIKVVGNPTSPDARMIVHWGGGGIDVYKSNGSQLVAESLGVYDDCVIDGSDVVITTKGQTKYRFTPLGGNMHYLTSVTDRNGNALTINYEAGVTGFQRVKSVSDGNRSLTFSYRSGTDLVSRVTDPLNRYIQFSYQLNNQTGRYLLSAFTDAEGHTTNYIYGDASTIGNSKLLTRIQLPKGNYIENEYDAKRRLKRTESGVNGVPTTRTDVNVTANYANSSTISTQSTVNVNRTGTEPSSYHYTYNGNNVVTAMTGEEGLFVNSTYGNDAHPQLPTTIQDNSTNVSNVTYDEKGNVTSVTLTGNGTLTTSMTYDAMNNLTSVTDPKNYTTTYTYDANGNLTGISQPEGVTTAITRDSRGLPVTVTNPMGVKTNMEYNTYGNLTKTTLPALNLTSTAAYDGASRLTGVTDALGRTTSFSYDMNDNLLSETDAANHTTGYTYDSNDNLTKITNAKGGVTTMTYDNATDWLTSVAFAGSTKHYSYNDDGTINTYTKPDGTALSYTYDDLGRITSDGVNSYSYDNKLRLSSITGGGKTLAFSYDGFNRVTGTSCGGSSNSYSYDKNGNRTSVNGTTYGYDKLNRMTTVKFNNKTITYTYRKDSQLSKVTYPNGMTTTFSYDAVGRLTGKTTKLSNGTIIASYSCILDKHGNIINQTTKEPYNDILLANEEISYTYNSGNRITKAGPILFSFDANGNTSNRGYEYYSWDEQDRLIIAGNMAIYYDPLGLIASYGYINFTTDPLGMGNVLSDSRSGAQYIYGNGLEARVIDGAVSYYVTDMRGSVVAIVNESGTITHKYQYDEFGKVVQKEEANYNPFQYVGKYGVMFLNEHLYYMRARYYDPTIGRFLSEDPIWSTNLYPYADNNPITMIDPMGKKSMKEMTAEELLKAIETDLYKDLVPDDYDNLKYASSDYVDEIKRFENWGKSDPVKKSASSKQQGTKMNVKLYGFEREYSDMMNSVITDMAGLYGEDLGYIIEFVKIYGLRRGLSEAFKYTKMKNPGIALKEFLNSIKKWYDNIDPQLWGIPIGNPCPNGGIGCIKA